MANMYTDVNERKNKIGCITPCIRVAVQKLVKSSRGTAKPFYTLYHPKCASIRSIRSPYYCRHNQVISKYVQV